MKLVPHFLFLHFPLLYFWSCIFQSCIFSPTFSGPAFSYPGNLVPHFPVVSVGLCSIWSLIGLLFSGPASSVDPIYHTVNLSQWSHNEQTQRDRPICQPCYLSRGWHFVYRTWAANADHFFFPAADPVHKITWEFSIIEIFATWWTKWKLLL